MLDNDLAVCNEHKPCILYTIVTNVLRAKSLRFCLLARLTPSHISKPGDVTHRENRVGHSDRNWGGIEGQTATARHVWVSRGLSGEQMTWLGLEAVDRRVFVGLHVEDGEEARDLQNVVNAFGEMQEFQLAAGVFHRGVSADEFADAGAVYVIHVVEAEQDFLVAGVHQIPDGLAQSGAAFAERDLAAEINDDDVAQLAACALESHGNLVC